MPPRDNGRLSLAEIDKYRGINCLGDSDLAADEPLWIAFDANAAICTAVTGQIRNGQFKTGA